jgi:hypothetical protein
MGLSVVHKLGGKIHTWEFIARRNRRTSPSGLNDFEYQLLGLINRRRSKEIGTLKKENRSRSKEIGTQPKEIGNPTEGDQNECNN